MYYINTLCVLNVKEQTHAIIQGSFKHNTESDLCKYHTLSCHVWNGQAGLFFGSVQKSPFDPAHTIRGFTEIRLITDLVAHAVFWVAETSKLPVQTGGFAAPFKAQSDGISIFGFYSEHFRTGGFWLSQRYRIFRVPRVKFFGLRKTNVRTLSVSYPFADCQCLTVVMHQQLDLVTSRPAQMDEALSIYKELSCFHI